MPEEAAEVRGWAGVLAGAGAVLMPWTNLECEMKENSKGNRSYTVSCHFANLTKEQRDHAYAILKGEKDLLDAAERIEEGKGCQ